MFSLTNHLLLILLLPVQSLCVLCDLENGTPCRNNQLCVQQSAGAGESEALERGECACIDGFAMNVSTGDCYTVSISANDSNSTSEDFNWVPFIISGPHMVTLPTSTVELEIVLPEGLTLDQYQYHWEMISGDGSSKSQSYNEPRLILTDLGPGQLMFRATVHNETHQGHQNHNLTILPEKRKNEPPHAVIKPESPVLGVEGGQIVLDAEGSTDDDKIAAYKWIQDQGPAVSLPAMDTAILRLEHLIPGSYVFSLVVTDIEGLSNNASVHVEVTAERDDSPKASIVLCGGTQSGSISLRLPLNELNLCGNLSTDDKGIVAYNWYRIDKHADKVPVDLSGSSTAMLTLTDIHENEQYGPYEFQLVVKDIKGQNDSTRISIFINKAENLAPLVDAGGNHTVLLPESSIVLDGNVKDDGNIVRYQWVQILGPSAALLSNENQAKATVSGLVEGLYAFQLNVTDDGGLDGSATSYITVERSKNEPPVARASNVTVFLPLSIASLNASASTDDAGIVSYCWEPFDDVPAAIYPLDNSLYKPVLFLSGLVVGNHCFNLTVMDHQKASNSITVCLQVERGTEDLQSVELLLVGPIGLWSSRLRDKLQNRISSVLSGAIKEVDEVEVIFTEFGQLVRDGHIRAVFHAKTTLSSNSDSGGQMRRRRQMTITENSVIFAEIIIAILEKEDTMKQDFAIESIEPKYCQLKCSGHGVCNNFTKQCECDAFWMTNLFTLMFNGWKHSDCSWSAIYVILLIPCFLIACFCSIVIIRKRRLSTVFPRISRRKFRRKRKYSALRSETDEEIRKLANEPRLRHIPLPPSSDSLASESDDLLLESGWELEERK